MSVYPSGVLLLRKLKVRVLFTAGIGCVSILERESFKSFVLCPFSRKLNVDYWDSELRERHGTYFIV